LLIFQSLPDHSLLYCDIKFSVDLCLNSQEIPNNDKRKYNISSIPNDFLVNKEIQVQLFEAIQKIENKRCTKCI
jgi:hypothetical protein